MNLILHPGHSKCGSTTIQQFLYDNRLYLEEKGFAIPDRNFFFGFEKESDFSVDHPSVNYLSNTSKNGTYTTLKRRIERALKKAETSNIHTFIISAENLSTPPTGPIHQIFSEYFKVKKVVYYIRRQDDFTLSAWQQWGYKTGRNLDEYCKFQITTGRPFYSLIASMLVDNYKQEAVDIVPFSRAVFYKGDLILDFLKRTDLEFLSSKVVNTRVENKSLSPLVCDYLSQYPDVFRTMHDNLPKTNLETYKEHQSWLFETRKDYLNTAQRDIILDYFEKQNRDLQQAYFPEVSYDIIFGRKDDLTQEKTRVLTVEQEEFLTNWANNWISTKKVRSFLRFKTNLLTSFRKRFS